MRQAISDFVRWARVSPSFWTLITCVTFYWISFVLVGNLALQIAVSSVGLVLVMVLLARWFPNARRAFIAGGLSPAQQQQLGLFVVFSMLGGSRVLSLMLTYFNQPDWLTESGAAGFLMYGVVCGIILKLYATRSDDGWSLRVWVRVTIAFALLALAITALVKAIVAG